MYNVMLVDDEETILTGLSRLLPWGVYKCRVVATADNAKTALQLIKHHEPDILFTDIRMPGMDGIAMIAAFRSEYPEMQIAVLSGHPEFDYAQKAIRLGVSHYILKPSKMAELEDALKCMVQELDRIKQRNALQAEQQAESAQASENSSDDTDENQADVLSAGNFIINNAIEYIEANYASKLTLPEVAEKVYVSQWHLSKLIARNTGQSFSELLNKVRITNAKKLLADPALRIWEISEKVGFSDVTHFSRIFRNLEHQSANEYRNQLVLQNNKLTVQDKGSV